MERMVVSGLAASAGRALGIIYEKSDNTAAIDNSVGHSSAERGRFYGAVNAAKRELMILADRAKGSLGEEESEIFFIHGLFLEDEDFLAAADRALMATHTAEYALTVARDYAIAALLATGDRMMMARCDDLRDVASRVLGFLSGKAEKRVLPNGEFLYFARDITPSEVLALQNSACVGIVLQEGSLGSHAAILANAMALPMLIEAKTPPSDGQTALLDCDRGELVIAPCEDEIAAYHAWCDGRKKREAALLRYRDKSFVYPSGRRLTVAANIGSLAELERARSLGAEGVGLFRSEFMFMERDTEPDEEEQFSLYRQIILQASPFAVIRLLDIGADKVPCWLSLPKEQNPALGLRGVRLLRDYPSLFKTQLRALLRASAVGEVVILLPMVIDPSEVKAFRTLIDTLADELVGEGHSLGKYTLGVMIETPSAALCCRALGELCGYFSIGSNDLFQYTMAIDRENPRALACAEKHPPSLLRLIDEVVTAAHEMGVKVSLCGELAGDLTLTEWLLSRELDVLSLSPSSILPIKEKVAEILKIREETP